VKVPTDTETGSSFINPVELGDRVRAKRRSEGLSIRELAAKIGVSAPTLSRVENGRHLPERENLLKIARWTGVSIDPPSGGGKRARVRDRAIHAPNASTVEAVEMHLRADKTLTRTDADTLSELFRLAYGAVSGRSGNGKTTGHDRRANSRT
jgi:transcriptional regulator with XRE-family HTH domain